MEQTPKIKKLIKKSYIASIKNSKGSKIFRNFYATRDGEIFDAASNGDAACAYFVSGILTMFGLIERIHLTVDRTVKDLVASGWKEIKRPKVGSVIVWERLQFDGEEHKHIGFYIGNRRAISNSSEKKCPVFHDWKFDGKREVIAILWQSDIK
ncbi:MAG: hypothetical protein WCT32_04280 [Patescibacteria group bacterium]|jgi:hypothetical protein